MEKNMLDVDSPPWLSRPPSLDEKKKVNYKSEQ